MKLFWKIVYNLLLLPIMFLLGLVFAIFRSKVREALVGRLGTIKRVKFFFSKVDRKKLVYWFHCASHGEYEQVRPILKGLKEIEKNCIVVVSFFSPSGFTNVNDLAIDLKIYLPLDFLWNTRRLLKIVRPYKLIFAEYDVWPNYVWTSRSLKVHTTLFSARLHKHSTKLWPLIRSFYRNVYSSLSSVYTIAEKDHVQLRRLLIKRQMSFVRVLGSPRYDRVKDLASKTVSGNNRSILERPFRFIAGSVWPEDDHLILNSLIDIVNSEIDFAFTWVPHEPKKKYISRTINRFTDAGLKPQLFSKVGDKAYSAKCAILDTVGHLSRHYWQGRFAYIGGGFTTGIHNVMEPAIARVPTIFGPRFQNSHAAEELIDHGGGFSVQTQDEFTGIIERLMSDEEFYLKSSAAATNVIYKNVGSSTRVLRGIIRD